ncbi:MAG: phosphoribosyl-AMP cyclohydrolase [Alphaproteobacteria bacterium]
MNLDFIDQINFNENGLIAAISVDVDSGDVLMMAWMNKEAIMETLQKNQVCYWSRSRKKLWRKGEQSGNQQQLVEMLLDCDKDTILLKVRQKGAACHTGRKDCFFYKVTDSGLKIISEPIQNPEDLYK